MRRVGAAFSAGALALLLATAARAEPPLVTGVEVTSPHRLPSGVAELAVEGLAGAPLDRERVRASLVRLWALGIFTAAEVEAVPEAGGVRLRFRVTRAPHLTRLTWQGDLGLPAPDLAAAGGLALGGSADPARLARARDAVLNRLREDGYLAAQVNVDVGEVADDNGRDVTMAVAAGKPAELAPLTVTGVPASEARGVARALGLREGDRFRERALREGLRAAENHLHAQGFFEARVTAAAPDWDRATNRVALGIVVEAGAPTRVVFEGREALPEATLREQLTFADARTVDEVETRASARRIEAAYHEAGYPFARVEATLAGEGPDRTVRVRIEEGPRPTVEAVDLEGVRSVPVARLLEQMQTRPARLLARGRFVEEKLAQDLRALARFLRTQGFAEAQVGPPRLDWAEDRTRVRIAIPVEEGRRRTIATVAVRGNRLVTEAEALAAIGLRPGDPWGATRADDARKQVETLYARRGHHAARVELETVDGPGGAGLVYTVAEEGATTRVGRVLIEGLTTTRPFVVRRELGLAPGDPLRPADLAEARRRLSATRLFDRVDVGPLRPAPEPFADVLVSVRESKPWRVELGAGYETEEGFRGFLTVGHDNLWGTGRSVSLTERVSQRGDRTEATYREPWVLATPWQGQAQAFRERREEIGFSTERLGTSLAVERELLPEWFRSEVPTDHPQGLRAGLRYRLEFFRRFDIDPDLVDDGIDRRDDRVASVTPILTLDLRDQPTDPRHGGFHLASLELGSQLLGGGLDFVKARLETAWFLDWLPVGVLAASARLGLAFPLAGTESLAIEDRFFAGGSTTVRGYRENRVGPRDAGGNPQGGNFQAILNLEWRFPIWRWLGGVAFLDAGAVTAEVGGLRLASFFPGAGVGLRIVTPIGPLRLDVGYGLRPLEDERRVQVHFSIGHAF